MIRSMNVAWWVERWAGLNPHKTAIHYQGGQVSYLELHERSEAVASWLQQVGIEKGDRVAVLLDNCLEFIELYLACARLGAVFVPFNFRLAAPEIAYLLGNCRPRLFVFKETLTHKVAPLALKNHQPPLLAAVVGQPHSVDFISYDTQVAGHAGQKPFLTSSLAPADPEEPQVIMYTSGTTGHPKGAVLTYLKSFFNSLNAGIFFQLGNDDVMLIILPLYHSGGLFIQATPCLYQGATLLLHPRFDARLAYADIETHRVTKFLGVPTVYRALLAVPHPLRGNLSSLKVCAIGGEQVTPELLRECREAGLAARQIMGQTETSILLWASEEESLKKPGSVGRPVFHAEVRLIAEDGRPISEPGQVGQIVARGPVVMKEYWRDPARSERALAGGWLHTGDLARRDEEGYYYLVGRFRDMYISGGENVYPAEVERVLQQHPQVAEAAVVGEPHEKWGESGHCFIIPQPGQNPGEEEIIAYCRQHLAAFKVPTRVTFCRQFPRTPLGKVRKFLLLEENRQA